MQSLRVRMLGTDVDLTFTRSSELLLVKSPVKTALQSRLETLIREINMNNSTTANTKALAECVYRKNEGLIFPEKAMQSAILTRHR
jgi:hypothetical protein